MTPPIARLLDGIVGLSFGAGIQRAGIRTALDVMRAAQGPRRPGRRPTAADMTAHIPESDSAWPVDATNMVPPRDPNDDDDEDENGEDESDDDEPAVREPDDE
jgi:hypothetical protein